MPSDESQPNDPKSSDGSSFFGRLFDNNPHKLEQEIHDRLNEEEANPRRTIEDEMNSLFQAFAGLGSQDRQMERDDFPFPASAFHNAFHQGFQQSSYHIHQDNQNVHVEFDVPGARKEEMSVEVVDIPSCVIEFGQSVSRRPTGDSQQYRQFSSSSFSQRLRLGPSVDCEKMSANLSRGVLRLSAPIKEEKDRTPERLSIPINEQ